METLRKIYIYPFKFLFGFYVLMSNKFSYDLSAKYIASINSSEEKIKNLHFTCDMTMPVFWFILLTIIVNLIK